MRSMDCRRALRYGRIVVTNFGCQFPDEKFLEEVGDSGCANSDSRVFKRQSRSLAILRRKVEIRNPTRGEAAKETRVICLPAPIVPLADQSHGERIQDPRSRTSVCLVKKTRILFQKRRQHGASNECCGDRVSKV